MQGIVVDNRRLDLTRAFALSPQVKPTGPGVQVSVPQTLVTPVAEHPEDVAENISEPYKITLNYQGTETLLLPGQTTDSMPSSLTQL